MEGEKEKKDKEEKKKKQEKGRKEGRKKKNDHQLTQAGPTSNF